MLTEEQRKRLEQAGWKPREYLLETIYERHATTAVVRAASGEVERLCGSLAGVVEFIAILGIAPKGYKLVPEEVAQAESGKVVVVKVEDWEAQKRAIEAGRRYLETKKMWDNQSRTLREFQEALSRISTPQPPEEEPR